MRLPNPLPILGKGGTMSEQELTRLGLSELRAKRDLQALRRQEARKKRDDKRKFKANVLVGIRECNGSEHERIPPGLAEHRAKKELEALRRLEARKKMDDKRIIKANALTGNATERLLGPGNRRAVGMESYGGDLERSQTRGNWNCNAATKPFLVRPACKPDCSQLNVMTEEKKSGFVVGDQLKRSVSTCSRRSSSGVSDDQSTSKQGGSSSDGGSHSSHCYPVDLTIKDCSTTLLHNPQLSTTKLNPDSRLSTYRIEPVQIPNKAPSQSQTNSSHHDETETSTGKKEATKGEGIELRKTPNMPCVAARGNGPNGRRIRGFLYRYTKSEVSIVCICHGTSFSAAGFVEHAGAVGIQNPLRHITISPSPSDQ